jgi:competence protein ComEC
VLRLRYGGRHFLLPGDAERQAERGILAENRPETLQSDVLKVGHHGGNNSTTQEFLRAVEPRIGIISVGKANAYGHPSPDLLERLTDGQQLEVTCFVPCPRAALSASTLAKVPIQNQNRDQK